MLRNCQKTIKQGLRIQGKTHGWVCNKVIHTEAPISSISSMKLSHELFGRAFVMKFKQHSKGWFIFIETVKNDFFGGNGWFQVKIILWQILDHLNIFQLIYNHFLIWPTFDLKTASGLQKAGIKKWSFGTHQKLVLIYKSMIEKLTNILQNEICHVQLS